jgi:hypothetical protein
VNNQTTLDISSVLKLQGLFCWNILLLLLIFFSYCLFVPANRMFVCVDLSYPFLSKLLKGMSGSEVRSSGGFGF